MNGELKEILSNENIHIIECDKNWCNAYGYEKSQLKVDLLNCITNLQQDKNISDDYARYLHNENKKLQKENERLKSRCENVQDLILNELSHLKANDEETWNKEFYDENNKLDYRKLCIELLNQVIDFVKSKGE